MTAMQRLKATCALWPYMVPLFVVYFAEVRHRVACLFVFVLCRLHFLSCTKMTLALWLVQRQWTSSLSLHSSNLQLTEPEAGLPCLLLQYAMQSGTWTAVGECTRQCCRPPVLAVTLER